MKVALGEILGLEVLKDVPDYRPTDKYAFVYADGSRLMTKEYDSYEIWDYVNLVSEEGGFQMSDIDFRSRDSEEDQNSNMSVRNMLPFEVD